MGYLEFDDEYNDSSSNENMDDKLKKWRRALRRTKRDRDDLPDIETIEEIVEYCIEKERFDDGLEFCNLWLEYTPDAVEALQKKSYILLNLSKPKSAMEVIERALTIDPFDRECLITKASILDFIYSSRGISR